MAEPARGVAGRRGTVLLGLALGALSLGTAALTWVSASTSSALEADVDITVLGSRAAPGVPAGGLVVLAASLALSIGGRLGRVVAALGIGLGGLLVLASALAAVRAPQAAAVSAARESVGVGALDSPAVLGPAPWVAVGVGALTVLLAVIAVRAAPSWGVPTERYERDGASPSDAATAARVAGRSTGGAGTSGTVPPHGSLDPGPEGPVVDERDTWDALSRGEDPT